MQEKINKLYNVWDNVALRTKNETDLRGIKLEEIIGSVFTAGPTYYFVINFFDMSLSNVSDSITAIHNLNPDTVTFNDIVGLTHPDDMEHVVKSENCCIENLIPIWDKLLSYKLCYSFRAKTADGSYRLFLHQTLTLTKDENDKCALSLNIHTDISHIAAENNNKISLIGLFGEPSYLNLSYENTNLDKPSFEFSRREIEILKLIADGISSAHIGTKLCITTETVKSHRKKILQKSGCKNMPQLVKIGIQIGLI